MGKAKAVLKRISGGLKMAAVWAPVAVGGLGVVSMIGGLIGCVSYESKITSDFTKTAIYQAEYVKDVKEATDAYDLGELSTEDYIVKIDYIGSDKYKKEVAKRDFEGNERFQGYLKSEKIATIFAFAGLGSFLGGGLLTLAWFLSDIYSDIAHSARRDFQKAREIIEQKNKEKNDKKKEEKPKKEDKKLMIIDATDDEEELQTVEDYLKKFQCGE